MEVFLSALTHMTEPTNLLALIIGVAIGLIVGVIPGLGGIFGLTLLVPVTYGMDPFTAIALLLGLSAVTTTSDTIPAVLLGIPGTVGSAATVVDGHPMAQKGEAARAFGAGYMASLIGGVFGALLLALSLPIIRPIMLSLNHGDFLAITIFAVTLIAMLSSKSPLKGLIAAMMGALLSFIGIDPHEGEFRWTFDQVYLYDGLPNTVFFLGFFGLAELAALIGRGRIQGTEYVPNPKGTLQGIADTLRNWRLVLKGSLIGSFLGAVPGIGNSIIDWIAYGDAARKPAKGVPFGEGNVRGVIAPESANNAKEGGALVPTLAFGIPGSASMTILLSAFLIQGVVPGPDMMTKHADLLTAMILAIAFANIIGTVVCLGLTKQLARIAVVPAKILAPLGLVFVVLGAFQYSKSPLDIGVLILFAALGIMMKRAGWPRPAFVLGFILGPSLERLFFISYQISGWGWLTQPFVMVLLAISFAGLFRQIRGWRRARVKQTKVETRQPFDRMLLILFFGVSLYAGITALEFPFAAGAFPAGVAFLTAACSAYLLWRIWRYSKGLDPVAKSFSTELQFLGLAILCGLLLLAFGHVYGPPLFLVICALWFRQPGVKATLAILIGVAAITYLVFDYTGTVFWPTTWAEMIWAKLTAV